MRYRKLRIAWSVVMGIACVLLIVLWVRSYWIQYIVRVPVTSERSIAASSEVGHLWFAYQRFSNTDWIEFDSGILSDDSAADFRSWAGQLGFNLDNDAVGVAIYLPDWFAILTASAISVIPWVR